MTFPILPVGNYTVKVEATGFEGYLQKGIVLQVDQNISVLAHLKVGSNTEVVQVTGDTGQNVDLVDATISEVIDAQRVVDLPLNGRDTLQLQYIMPGVSYDNNGVAHGQGQHEGVVVNGNRPGSNYYLLDGVDMTDSYLSVAPVFPAPDKPATSPRNMGAVPVASSTPPQRLEPTPSTAACSSSSATRYWTPTTTLIPRGCRSLP